MLREIESYVCNHILFVTELRIMIQVCYAIFK
jgi:hypothetical protein